ncbi:S-layer homology domain-containing protein, partial [Faecalibacterium sp. DFI.5.82]|nr:S-layer homology domain-containing protein [Faecalibacterium sp. DFI.5.82]
TIRAGGTALGDAALASDVEILDTTAEGLAGTVSPSRLSGVTLSASDVRYYTVDENGAIDRLILNDATGDLWTYGVLDDVTNLISTAASSTTNTGSG